MGPGVAALHGVPAMNLEIHIKVPLGAGDVPVGQQATVEQVRVEPPPPMPALEPPRAAPVGEAGAEGARPPLQEGPPSLAELGLAEPAVAAEVGPPPVESLSLEAGDLAGALPPGLEGLDMAAFGNGAAEQGPPSLQELDGVIPAPEEEAPPPRLAEGDDVPPPRVRRRASRRGR